MSQAARYRKRPITVEAMQWTGGADSAAPIVDWINAGGGTAQYDPGMAGYVPHSIIIATLEGALYTSPGDWIIRGIKGEYYPCKPEIFAATYEQENG